MRNIPQTFYLAPFNISLIQYLPSFLFSSRSRRSATPPQPLSWATTLATTSSLAWCHRTRTRPRPWWTSSQRWSGTTCPRWPQKATTARAAWRPLSRFPEKPVRAALSCLCLTSGDRLRHVMVFPYYARYEDECGAVLHLCTKTFLSLMLSSWVKPFIIKKVCFCAFLKS